MCLLIYIYMYLVRDILNIFNLHSTTPSKIKCISSFKKQKRQKVIRNDYLHTFSRFKRVLSSFESQGSCKLQNPSFTQAWGVRAHAYTSMYTYMYSPLKNKWGEKGKKERKTYQLALPAPPPQADLVGFLGQG